MFWEDVGVGGVDETELFEGVSDEDFSLMTGLEELEDAQRFFWKGIRCYLRYDVLRGKSNRQLCTRTTVEVEWKIMSELVSVIGRLWAKSNTRDKSVSSFEMSNGTQTEPLSMQYLTMS